jgi:hypothetical protein
VVSIVGYTVGEIVAIIIGMYALSLSVIILSLVYLLQRRLRLLSFLAVVIPVIVVTVAMNLPFFKIGWVAFYNGLLFSMFIILPLVVRRPLVVRNEVVAPVQPVQPYLYSQEQRIPWQRPPWMK